MKSVRSSAVALLQVALAFVLGCHNERGFPFESEIVHTEFSGTEERDYEVIVNGTGAPTRILNGVVEVVLDDKGSRSDPVEAEFSCTRIGLPWSMTTTIKTAASRGDDLIGHYQMTGDEGFPISFECGLTFGVTEVPTPTEAFADWHVEGDLLLKDAKDVDVSVAVNAN